MLGKWLLENYTLLAIILTFVRPNINSTCALEILVCQSSNLSLPLRLNLNLCNKIVLDDLILGKISGEL